MYSWTTALRIAVFRSSNMVLMQVIDGGWSAGTHSPRVLTGSGARRGVRLREEWRRIRSPSRRAGLGAEPGRPNDLPAPGRLAMPVDSATFTIDVRDGITPDVAQRSTLMNSSTCKKIGAGVVTLIAGSVLSLSADGADARMCLDAQGDGQCVVTPPTATPTPAHDCPIINGTSLCASDADLGLSGSGGTFVAGVYLPDIVKVDAPPEIYISPTASGSASPARPSSLATPRRGLHPGHRHRRPHGERSTCPNVGTGAPRSEVYIPDIVKGSG